MNKDKKITTIVVAGSSGMIGTALCEDLMKDENIVLYPVDKRENIFNKELNKKTILLDLSVSTKKLPENIDIFIHLAANARVHKLVLFPELAKENLDSLWNSLEFCRKNNIKKFIFASSREVYGSKSWGKCNEKEVDIDNVKNSYTAMKIAGEVLIRAYAHCYGIDYIIYRFSNVYGKYDLNDRVIPLFIVSALQNKDITIFGDEKKLDFTYIDDVIYGINYGVRFFDKVKNDVYNVCGGKGVFLSEVAKKIIIKTKSKSKIIYQKNRTGEIESYSGNIDKAKKKLNFSPKIKINEGIDKAIQWYYNIVILKKELSLNC